MFLFYFFLGPGGRAGVERQLYYMKERWKDSLIFKVSQVTGFGTYEIYNNRYMVVSRFQRIFQTSYC